MKLLNNFLKELRLATRDFYFLVEMVIAVLILGVLLLVVSPDGGHVSKEAVFMDMTDQQKDELLSMDGDAGRYEFKETVTFKLKPATLHYTDDRGNKQTLEFSDRKKIKADKYYYYDANIGRHTKTKYLVDNFDDMMRLSYQKKYMATQMWFGEDGMDYYKTVLFGYESEKFKNVIIASHGKTDVFRLASDMIAQKENTIFLSDHDTLNNREKYVPLLLVFLNLMMAMLIIIAYISVDKAEGVYQAITVTPFSTHGYLLSKMMVVCVIMFLSSAIFTVPVMRGHANYALLGLTLLALTVFGAVVGIFISTFFKDVVSAFTVIMGVDVLLFLPAITYLDPAFHPAWMNYLPTYHLLEAMKESCLTGGDVTYVLTVCAVLFFASVPFYLWAVRRMKNGSGM